MIAPPVSFERVTRDQPPVRRAHSSTQAPGGPRPARAVASAIGNRRLAALLARAPRLRAAQTTGRGDRVLARYDTGEHVLFGSDRVVYVRAEVRITAAEMLAMADLYESVEDMDQADLDELRRLLALVRRDRDAYLGVRSATHVSNAEWEHATPTGRHRRKSFLDMAEDNVTHFGPSPTFGPVFATAGLVRDHRAQWERMHKQALDLAHGAKTQDELQRALAINAFSGHFLTDAFSAGHLPSKDDLMDRAKTGPGGFAGLRTWGWFVHENDFTRKVGERLMADPVAGPKLRAYRIRIVRWHEMSAEHISELLYGFADDDDLQEKFYGSLAKAVHDRLGRLGVEVSNARGDGPWVLRGDTHLLPDDPWEVSRAQYEASRASSRETLRVGRAAVAESVANVLEASRAPGPLDYDALFKRVWTYAPQPTAAGRRQIDEAMDLLLDLRRPEAVEAFAQVTIDNVDLLIAKLTDPARDRLATPEEIERRAERFRVESMRRH